MRRDRAVARAAGGETWRRLEAHFPDGHRHPLRAPGLLLRRRAAPAPPRLHRRGGRRLGARGAHVRRPRRGRRAAASRPGAGCARSARGNRPLPLPTLVSSATLRDRGRNERHEADALAHPGLALQREGPLGARPQAGRARAPGAAPRRPHGVRAVADPRARTRPSRCSRLDGRNIGDSTAIIAALERRWPEHAALSRPTRPSAAARSSSRSYFDEQLGPQIRLLAWHELRTDRERMERARDADGPGPAARPAGFRRLAAARRFGSPSSSCASGSPTTRRRPRPGPRWSRRSTGSRPSSTPTDGEYLVGDRFSVADLTAAALFYPLVNPPEGPQVLPATGTPALRGVLRAAAPSARATGGSSEMFARHRKPARSSRRADQLISTIASISTGTSNGSCAAPIAERAWRPAGRPRARAPGR